jgi:hypothetical protein
LGKHIKYLISLRLCWNFLTKKAWNSHNTLVNSPGRMAQ